MGRLKDELSKLDRVRVPRENFAEKRGRATSQYLPE